MYSELLSQIVLISFSILGIIILANGAANLFCFIFGDIGLIFQKSDKVAPKKVFKKKPKEIQELIDNGGAEIETIANIWLHDNREILTKLKTDKHNEFLDICDGIVKKDGFITDIEIILIGQRHGFMELSPVLVNTKKGRIFNILLTKHLEL